METFNKEYFEQAIADADVKKLKILAGIVHAARPSRAAANKVRSHLRILEETLTEIRTIYGKRFGAICAIVPEIGKVPPLQVTGKPGAENGKKRGKHFSADEMSDGEGFISNLPRFTGEKKYQKSLHQTVYALDYAEFLVDLYDNRCKNYAQRQALLNREGLRIDTFLCLCKMHKLNLKN